MENLPARKYIAPPYAKEVDDGKPFAGSEIVYQSSVPWTASKGEKRIQTETTVSIYRPRIIQDGDGTAMLIGLKIQTRGLHEEDANLLDELSFTVRNGTLPPEDKHSLFAAGIRNGPLIGDKVGDWVFPNDHLLIGYPDVLQHLTKFAVDHPEIDFKIIAYVVAKIISEYLKVPAVSALRDTTKKEVYALDLFDRGYLDADIFHNGHALAQRERERRARTQEAAEWCEDAVWAAIHNG